MGYLPFDFQRYGIFVILLSGIWILSIVSGILQITKGKKIRVKKVLLLLGGPPLHISLHVVRVLQSFFYWRFALSVAKLLK